MNFEEMTIIWNQQNEKPLFAFDREALLRAVSEKHRRFQRCNRKRDWIEFGSAVVAAAVIGASFIAALYPDAGRLGDMLGPRREALGLELLGLALATAGWAAYAIFTFWRRKRFARRAARLDQSMEADLGAVMGEVRERITHLRLMLRWGIPYCFLTAMFYVITFMHLAGGGLKEGLLLSLMMAVALAFEYRCSRSRLRHDLLPRLADLEALRGRLAESERSPDDTASAG